MSAGSLKQAASVSGIERTRTRHRRGCLRPVRQRPSTRQRSTWATASHMRARRRNRAELSFKGEDLPKPTSHPLGRGTPAVARRHPTNHDHEHQAAETTTLAPHACLRNDKRSVTFPMPRPRSSAPCSTNTSGHQSTSPRSTDRTTPTTRSWAPIEYAPNNSPTRKAAAYHRSRGGAVRIAGRPLRGLNPPTGARR